MALEVIEVDTQDRRQAHEFLTLPFRLYQNVPQWVPPLWGDARRMLDRHKNPFFQHSEAAFFLARDGKTVLGRLAVLDHRPYNRYNQEKTAFFYLFECEHNQEAALGLFEQAFAWAQSRGLERMIGPKGFTPLDGMGLLVHGFEHRPAFGIPYNPAYYPALLEAAGFHGTEEIVSGYLSGSVQISARFHQLAERIKERRGLRVARFKRRQDLQAVIPSLKELYNLSIEETAGNYPVSDQDVQAIADLLLRFADPTLIKILMKDTQVVGFLFAYPDISAAVQRSRGRLFPTGWLHILREMRQADWVNINGIGILKEYRGLGGTALLFSELQKSILSRGFKHADLVQIGVENAPMQRELRSLGVDFYKKHRMYHRDIPPI